MRNAYKEHYQRNEKHSQLPEILEDLEEGGLTQVTKDQIISTDIRKYGFERGNDYWPKLSQDQKMMNRAGALAMTAAKRAEAEVKENRRIERKEKNAQGIESSVRMELKE